MLQSQTLGMSSRSPVTVPLISFTQFLTDLVCVCGVGVCGCGCVSKQETFQYHYQIPYFNSLKMWDIMKQCSTGKSANFFCRRIGAEIWVKSKMV